MTAISRRDLFKAAFANLQAVDHQTAYAGEPGEVPLDERGAPLPYTCLWPGAGDPDVELDLADTATDLDWSLSITAAAGDVETLMALIDRVDAAFYRWEPQVAGLVVGPFRPPAGYEPVALLDRNTKPYRPYALLQYRTTITAS